MAHAAKVYEAKTGVKVQLLGGGATLGIQAVGEGAADFGGTCRHCIATADDGELPLALTLVAWDALTVIVHPSNPVDELTVGQLRGVLEGKVTNWKELGGEDRPILVVARKGKTSGVGYMLRELILGEADFEFGPRTLRLESSGPVEKLVERSPGAIAISGVSSARLRALKLLRLGGVEPTQEQIAKGKYPYYRPLYIAHAPNLEGPAADFRMWLLGPRGQAAVAEMGTVTLEAGLGLVGSFKAFGDRSRITNLASLEARLADRRHAEESGQ